MFYQFKEIEINIDLATENVTKIVDLKMYIFTFTLFHIQKISLFFGLWIMCQSSCFKSKKGTIIVTIKASAEVKNVRCKCLNIKTHEKVSGSAQSTCEHVPTVGIYYLL